MPRAKLFDESEVLNRALDLFWKKGFAATSMQDLVTHLGINRASLYSTFGDKETLFNKAILLYIQINLDAIKLMFSKNPIIKEGLRKLFKKTIDEAVKGKIKKGCFVVNSTTELIPNDSKTLAILKENKNNFEKLIYDYLLFGVDKGQISKELDIQSLATLFNTFNNGLGVVTKVEVPKSKLLKSIDTLLSVLD